MRSISKNGNLLNKELLISLMIFVERSSIDISSISSVYSDMPKVDDKKKEYNVLGLHPTANEVEVKKAFARLALRYHPDLYSVNKTLLAPESLQYSKSKFHEICKAYKKIMAEEDCTLTDWNNDKSDEIFFSLLGELLQNNTRATELYTLLSSQANNKSQFQNDNEYRCKEDVMEDDHEESDLNKLVDILKNRLQNGKSVPAGLTQEKLTRLKDDFLKQKEENKRTEQNHSTPTKKTKNAAPVLVAKPKPKNKKQLQAEQRRRELEMANIAKELEEKKKKEEEKEQVRKKQEKERKRLLEEDIKRQEEDKKRQLNESRKKKEKEEKEKEYRLQKEKERQERMKKTQEEEQRRKEEEKRRKTEEKTAKQKALKEGKEKEEREKLEKQLTQNQKSQSKVRSQQYQQYQQQQQKYPREVPPRFLRQQQIKQQLPHSEQEFSATDSNHYRENSNWTEIVPDANYDTNNLEDWDVDIDEDVINGNDQGQTNTSWGGIPASEDWDLDVNKPQSGLNQDTTRPFENNSISSSDYKNNKVGKNLFGAIESTVDVPVASSDCCWGASLTGSTWDTGPQNAKQWDEGSVHSENSLDGKLRQQSNGLADGGTYSTVSRNTVQQSTVNSSWCKYSNKPVSVNSNKSDNPGITPWAGLDSFEAAPVNIDGVNHVQSPVSINNVFTGGAKPKTINPIGGTYSLHSDISDKVKASPHTRLKETGPDLEPNDASVDVSSIDTKIDTNLKVTGWLESSTPSEDWDEDDKENNDEDFGWTTVSLKTKKPVTGGNPVTSAPSTPSKSENGNAWTNRALKQLLDMGFKREHAEKALRDNNGIIESAVSDLLMKGDMTESTMVSSKQTASKIDSNDTPPCNGILNQTTTPQKLNRKQRRKLQQMQNAEQFKESDNVKENSAIVSTSNAVDNNSHTLNSELNINKKGDGLLPTPPPSLRLVPNEKSPIPLEKTITRPQSSKVTLTEVSSSLLKTTVRPPPPIGQPAKLESDQNSSTHAPIGTSRPSIPMPIQPPIQQPKAQANQASSTTKENHEQMNGTPLQPPVNPVLLAQMHLQKLGLENAPVLSSSYSTPSASAPSSSQTVTNSMIQQYLQQIAQSSEVEPTATVCSSPITTPLHTASTMHLSGLLQQAPVPASSLSEGPQKSKLLQWTQPSSASNSEPTTPPSSTEYPEEPKEKSTVVNKVDPVSAKWGVVAAPRLSPTHAEFKPGVPWKSRGDLMEMKDGDSDPIDVSDDEILPSTENTPNLQNAPARSTPDDAPVKAAEPMQPSPPLPSPLMPNKLPEQAPIRPPPGLGSVNSFSGMKTRVDEMNWLTIRGLSSAIDPASIRSLCQQFGTLLDFRIIGNTMYLRYETHAHAHSAYISLNGKLIFNSQILAEVSTEYECMKVIDNSTTIVNNPPVGTVPLSNHVSQPIAPAFPNISSFGGLWTTPGQNAPPSVPQPFVQQSFAPTYAAQSSLSMNGGFAHWGLPSAPAVIPNTNQLWQAAPQQPTNVFQTYPGWLTTKPADVPVQASIFSPGMDRCLPSELFNAKEHGS